MVKFCWRGISVTRSTSEDGLAHLTPLLVVRNLVVSFEARSGGRSLAKNLPPAVDGVSFELARGSVLAVVGESGCGKTTLARAILRLIEPSSGQVRFDGIELLQAKTSVLREVRRRVQMVFQDTSSSLNPRLTVGTIVAEPMRIQHDGPRSDHTRRVGRLLLRVGLRPRDAYRFPHELSGGQRQRVGIARAISISPQLIILDEPVSALDVSVRAQILNLLVDLQRELGLAYLFISHDLSTVRYISNRVAVMLQGRIVEIGPTEEVFAHPQHPYTIELLRVAQRSVPNIQGNPNGQPVSAGWGVRCRGLERNP